VDGIPIESSTFDAGESGSSKKKERADAKNIDPTDLSTLDPKELFWRYDFDESGGIDFDEFKALLKDLKIEISEPKALAYFKKCDPRRKGHISFEEFRLALYTCDPSNPSRTGGFCPTKNLSPKDLFEMFEREEGSGVMNRDGFADVFEFLNMKMPLHRMENIFAEYEDVRNLHFTYFDFGLF
jgi:Ca2+-binding EF-hand superfamily protein